ncbi:MAG: hypothetical protein ABSB22_09630 [Thermodesulfobacteriota bacterium]|jgi:hypothetical protein
MTAYEFYWRDVIEGYHSIGILPERRRIPERITRESIMNYGRIVLGENFDQSNLSFVQITIRKDTLRIFHS